MTPSQHGYRREGTIISYLVVNILANLGELSGIDVYPEFTPNAETLEAISELENGGGHKFSGSTEDLLAELLED